MKDSTYFYSGYTPVVGGENAAFCGTFSSSSKDLSGLYSEVVEKLSKQYDSEIILFAFNKI